MTGDRVLVDLIGAGLIALRVWFFWLVKTKGQRAPVIGAGDQEQMGLVKGGYTPDVIVVEAGKPIRLDVFRRESASCSEMMLVPAFDKSAKLPEGTTVPVEFLPQERGEFACSCPTGMLRGNGSSSEGTERATGPSSRHGGAHGRTRGATSLAP
jgi:plastocyanin domain-containing protein